MNPHSPKEDIPHNCQTTYDHVADEYARRIFDELAYKSLDCLLLDCFADSVRNIGPACDIGCGPGHVAAYLHARGADMCGIDLSPGMVAQARQLVPGVEFREGDILALPVPDKTWAGIVAFYSLIHIPPARMPQALAELRRALQPGGLLLLAFHIGDAPVHLDEWWGRNVCVDFYFFRPAAMEDDLRGAGFDVEETIERDPYPDVEHPSRRAYIFARRFM